MCWQMVCTLPNATTIIKQGFLDHVRKKHYITPKIKIWLCKGKSTCKFALMNTMEGKHVLANGWRITEMTPIKHVFSNA